jgi:hypothetical protein
MCAWTRPCAGGVVQLLGLTVAAHTITRREAVGAMNMSTPAVTSTGG